jgi:hypothetical protein
MDRPECIMFDYLRQWAVSDGVFGQRFAYLGLAWLRVSALIP